MNPLANLASRLLGMALGVLALGSPAPASGADEIRLLNASFDISRELFREINPAFRYAWRESTALALAMIATLAGNDGRAVLKEIHEYYHTHGVETFAEWEAANG